MGKMIEPSGSVNKLCSPSPIPALNNNLNAKVPGSVKLLVEGSGANTKYYIQNGADAATKKLLGNISLTGYSKDFQVFNTVIGTQTLTTPSKPKLAMFVAENAGSLPSGANRDNGGQTITWISKELSGLSADLFFGRSATNVMSVSNTGVSISITNMTGYGRIRAWC